MSIVPQSFAGRPPTLARVSPNDHAALAAALATYRDVEALTDRLDGLPADLTARQRARLATLARDGDETPFFDELREAEGRLVLAILRAGRRWPCGMFRDGGSYLTCKGVVDGNRLFLAVDVVNRYDPRDRAADYQLAVIDLAGVAEIGGAR